MRECRYKIEYKAGKDNVVADQLSRPVQNIRVEDMWLGKTREELVNLQRQDRRWREMIDYLHGGKYQEAGTPGPH